MSRTIYKILYGGIFIRKLKSKKLVTIQMLV